MVTKVKVKGKKNKHWHVSRKLLKLQSPNLAQRYMATMRFTTSNTVTLTEGQGHKGQGQRSQNETLACFSETIEATVTKFGTKVHGDNALHNVSNTMTLIEAEGQGHK